jgi:hypothetical protein
MGKGNDMIDYMKMKISRLWTKQILGDDIDEKEKIRTKYVGGLEAEVEADEIRISMEDGRFKMKFYQSGNHVMNLEADDYTDFEGGQEFRFTSSDIRHICKYRYNEENIA